MGQVKPIHYDEATISQLTRELAIASCIGALKGAAIGITSALLLRTFSPVYRNVRTQVKVFYHCAWISMGVVVQADKQVISFQERYYRDEMVRRARILDEAADRGIFLEEDAAAISTTSN
ncbi:AGR244Wp [Eremothecium gossypii ATCC 10895]|uniref:AGR244Wp n=1 Tax=Eremothecium gossypii (strain ATCC 10895 / CBS 109.51 / FGSC 9923 / NRRL Y-1056) TaxID=284811 RepID=Q74ZF5_EREGS|nr:AGR244Wp [Eremothecium gossypii ATCC 10895]AAS54734.1 AGR244Wp [Eremothecium gossypii ATCC 10895]AEY99065.1 FAGR244Wp [Eremothecium gossypii FDAG1]